MTTFNTGNPVPSAAVKDLYDNAQTADELVNSASPTTVSRTSKVLQTWSGLTALYNSIIASLGWESTHLTYVDGQPLTVARPSQLINYNGGVYAVKQPATFPLTLTGTWATDSSKLVDVGDASVRSDLANATDATRGAGMVGWFADGAGAVARKVIGKLREWVSIGDFGGADDNATDNGPKFTAVKTAVGTGGRFRMVRKFGGIFRFTSPFDMKNVVIDNDRNLVLRLNETEFPLTGSSAVVVEKPLKLHFETQNYNYDFYPDNSEAMSEKRVWKGTGDIDNSFAENLSLTSLPSYSVSWPSGDTWTPANPVLNSDNPDVPYLFWPSGSASTFYMTMTPVVGGDEIDVCFATGGSYLRFGAVRCAGGYYGIYADGAGHLNFVTKLNGQAATNPVFGQQSVFGTNPQYYGENAKWKIKVISKRSFAIYLNGVRCSSILVTASDILQAGFGYMPQTVTSIAMYGFMRTRQAPIYGLQNVGVTIVGDSRTADIHGGFAQNLRKALEGYGGLIVDNVSNLAVPGYTAQQAFDRMRAVGFVGGVTVIAVGTNDIQALTNINTWMATMRAGIKYAADNGQTVVVNIPGMFYTQAEAGAGKGQNSQNAIAGAPYRMLLAQLCARMQVACVDLTTVTGPADVRYMLGTFGSGVDDVLRDNIHETPLSYKKEAYATADRIVGALAGRISKTLPLGSLAATLNNGWTSNSNIPVQYEVKESGDWRLSGVLNKGTTFADGTVIFTLRLDCKVRAVQVFSVATDSGLCRLQVNLDNTVQIYGFNSAWSWVALDSVQILA